MGMERVFRAVGLVALIAAVGTTSAEAVDMTGTWTGRERCDCFNDVAGSFTERYNDQVMQISQDGTDLNVSAYDQLYNGNAIDHPTRRAKGEASLIACNTDPENNASLGEVGRAKVSARSTGRGRMTIKSLWNTAESQICTCKARFVRTDATDPEIGECSDPDVVDTWHAAMLGALPTTGRCHEVEHPSEEWVEVSCGEPPAKYSQSAKSRAGPGSSERKPRRVGGPYLNTPGYQLQAVKNTNSHLFMVTGSFENVSGVTSIVDSRACYEPSCGGGHGDGVWSLQLNSNHFDNPPECHGKAGCKGWQQFVYSSMVPGDLSHGQLIIEYWLYGYGAQDYSECPSLPSPQAHYSGTHGHWNYAGDGACYMDTGHYNLASTATAADLSDISLTGSAGTSIDQAIIRIGTKIHALSTPNVSGGTDPFDAPDSILSLSRYWQHAEFNIFGYAGATTAVFNPGLSADVSMDVKMTINYPHTGHFTCPLGGTTGESNSLNLDKALRGCNKIPHQTPMSFKFTQNSK